MKTLCVLYAIFILSFVAMLSSAGIPGVKGMSVGTQTVYKAYVGNALVYNNNTIDPALLLHWSMTEGSGLTVADTSGKGNTLTLGAGASWSTRPGGGGALRLPGSVDSYATSQNTVQENFLTGWSFSAWIKPVALSSGQYFKDSDDNVRSLVFGYMYLSFNMYNLSWPLGLQSLTSALGIDGWNHVVYTSNGTRLKEYVNGEKLIDVAVDLSPVSGTARVCLGGYWVSENPTPNFNGYIDEVRIYSKVLTDEEVTTIYNNTR